MVAQDRSEMNEPSKSQAEEIMALAYLIESKISDIIASSAEVSGYRNKPQLFMHVTFTAIMRTCVKLNKFMRGLISEGPDMSLEEHKELTRMLSIAMTHGVEGLQSMIIDIHDDSREVVDPSAFCKFCGKRV